MITPRKLLIFKATSELRLALIKMYRMKKVKGGK
jgi:hypothetical protein